MCLVSSVSCRAVAMRLPGPGQTLSTPRSRRARENNNALVPCSPKFVRHMSRFFVTVAQRAVLLFRIFADHRSLSRGRDARGDAIRDYQACVCVSPSARSWSQQCSCDHSQQECLQIKWLFNCQNQNSLTGDKTYIRKV